MLHINSQKALLEKQERERKLFNRKYITNPVTHYHNSQKIVDEKEEGKHGGNREIRKGYPENSGNPKKLSEKWHRQFPLTTDIGNGKQIKNNITSEYK